MTPLFTVDCSCGRKVVIDSDTMRKVPDACRACGAKGAHFCPGHPAIRNVSEYTPKKWARGGRLSEEAPTRRVSLVDEPGDWPEDAA